VGERGDGPVAVARFIAAQRAEHQIPHATACRALGVSPAWFYKWRDGDASRRRARREQLTAEIRRLFAARRGRYGSPRITADLRDQGWRVSENTVAKIMAEQRLVARRRRGRRGGTRPGRGRWRAPDLVGRRFATQRVNRRWYGDGTEIVTDEGKLYLASVLDMGSRRIVGFALGAHHDAELAYAALAMAVAVRGGAEAIGGVILHTDRGSEYTAGRVRAACARLGVRQSMGRPGSALDNAVIESWHSTLEFELRRLEHFATTAQARAAVAAWIEEYNHDRRHSALGMLSPIAYERSRTTRPSRQRDRRFRLPSVAPSSPGSRPSPAGGLRPALPPAAGGTLAPPPNPARRTWHQDQDPPIGSLHTFGGWPPGESDPSLGKPLSSMT
jgi:putative transposase